MKTITRLAATSAAAGALVLMSSSARAADSTRGPFYIQVDPVGYAGVTGCKTENLPDPQAPGVFHQVSNCYAYGGYRAGLEAGYHFSKRHDGFMLGLRQAFYFAGGNGSTYTVPVGGGFGLASFGATQLRVGYDIAIPIKDFELTVAPFVALGLTYEFDTTYFGFAFSGGVDGKFFFTKGFYAFVRPLDIGAWVPGGLTYQFAAGVGFALGGR